MYEIKAIKSYIYKNCWEYKSKNSAGQIVHLQVFQISDYENILNVSFYITSKRKQGYQENKITGRDGISSLLWAKNCVLHFLNNFSNTAIKDKRLVVCPANSRLRRIYARTLLPIGFKISRSRFREFYIDLKSWKM